MVDYLTLGREKLLADRTYYVRTNGSNSNNGLANTAGGAFLTPQYALEQIAKIDFNGFTVTLQLGDGTYTSSNAAGTLIVPVMTGQNEPADFIIKGNTTTPSNVIVENTGSFAPAVVCNGSRCAVQAFRVKASNFGYGLNAAEAGVISVLAGMDFGDCSGQYHMYANNGGIINVFQSYTISGPASAHWAAAYSGAIFAATTMNANSASIAFSFAFAAAISNGSMQVNGMTFQNVASVTGARYATQTNGVIQTFGGGASYLPGNSAGSNSSGGQYA